LSKRVDAKTQLEKLFERSPLRNEKHISVNLETTTTSSSSADHGSSTTTDNTNISTTTSAPGSTSSKSIDDVKAQNQDHKKIEPDVKNTTSTPTNGSNSNATITTISDNTNISTTTNTPDSASNCISTPDSTGSNSSTSSSTNDKMNFIELGDNDLIEIKVKKKPKREKSYDQETKDKPFRIELTTINMLNDYCKEMDISHNAFAETVFNFAFKYLKIKND
jgi:hypothetical protein